MSILYTGFNMLYWDTKGEAFKMHQLLLQTDLKLSKQQPIVLFTLIKLSTSQHLYTTVLSIHIGTPLQITVFILKI